MTMQQIELGSTKKFTWINSGATVTAQLSLIRTGSETIINTVSLTDSGNGHWFSLHTFLVGTFAPGYYSQEFRMTIGGNPYNARQRFRLIQTEVD